MDPTTESLIAAAMLGLSFTDEMELFKTNAVFADLDSVPENRRGELIDGNVWLLPRPIGEHALAIGEIFAHLAPAKRDSSPDGWVLASDVEILFGPHVLVPDLTGWRRSRMPRLPQRVVTYELRPDWVCEVLSPSTARFDKGRKKQIYASAGVEYMWWMDPFHKTVDVGRLGSGGNYTMVACAGADDKIALPPFDGIEIDFGLVWAC